MADSGCPLEQELLQKDYAGRCAGLNAVTLTGGKTDLTGKTLLLWRRGEILTTVARRLVAVQQYCVKQSLCEAVVKQVVERCRAAGLSEHVVEDVQKHFARLPARYALNIDPQRYEDLLLHMRLMAEAREAQNVAAHSHGGTGDEAYVLPCVHVRRVALVVPAIGSGTSPRTGWPIRTAELDDDGDLSMGSVSSRMGSADASRGGGGSRQGIPIPGLPRPAFGSGTNLSAMGASGGSPRVGSLPRSYPRSSSYGRLTPLQSRNTPPGLRDMSPGRPRLPRPAFGGSYTNLAEMGEDDAPRTSHWEITVATADIHGLLKYLTSVLSNSSLELDIKEAHVFSSIDSMALEVFVVEGWSGDDPEELQQAVLAAVVDKLHGKDFGAPFQLSEEFQMQSLRAAAEAIQYEDWAVNFQDLELGSRLGGGSSGRLYRAKYRGQDVAVKVIMLADGSLEGISGSLRPAPGSELLQMFKQEVAIMRIVRHKNLIQFIGACLCWPRLCIVTELMAGGSVRDMMQNKGGGLEPLAALKVLRDAARGMDFLHRRGVVHRDLKAANLLIDEHDVVKVCDFGVARMKPGGGPGEAAGEASEMTAETGTYRWMAPEVLEHCPYDHRVDVYSFGIMIWEILTGDIPYAGLTPLQAAIGVVQRQLRPVMPTTAPPKLKELAQRCWSTNPADRPEFDEILAILEDCMKPAVMWKKGLFGVKKKTLTNL
eukprot:SM000006S19344  [mRNA]  locus=s6:214523:219235:+ [translate_table: standard]